jgi:hypothetical protein
VVYPRWFAVVRVRLFDRMVGPMSALEGALILLAVLALAGVIVYLIF